MRAVELQSGGRTLAADLVGPVDGDTGILFVHGLDSDRSGYRERAAAVAERLGAVCLAFDLGGHGESTGARDELSLADHLADVVAAYDRLAVEGGVEARRIGVAGASYGGYLAAVLTARRPVWRLALRAPALYDDADLDVPRAARPRRAGPPAAAAALSAVQSFAGRVLVVESERDEAVPHEIVAAYLAARPDAAHVLIPGAEHHLGTPEARAAFLMALLDFFAAS